MYLLYSLVVILSVLQQCLPANILAVTTMFSPSHYIWNKVILKELAQKGHNITVLTHEKDNEEIANYTMITMEGAFEYLNKHLPMEEFAEHGPLKSIMLLWRLEELSCELDLKSTGLQTLLNYPRDYKFDLIIWDLNRGRCLYPIIDRFGKPPVIGTSPFGNPPYMNYAFGAITSSHVPFYQISSQHGINFLTRLKTFICNYATILTRYYYATPNELRISKEFFGNNIRSIDEVEREISLVLSNIDPVLNHIGPLPANVIPVGGIHSSSVKKLPNDLQVLLDNAKDGVIVVAFGSELNWLNFGEEQKAAFIGLFQKLNQTILLKSPLLDFELPKNVILRQWIPQNDVLAHHNVKLLITHGGGLTTQEAIINGVPILGVPIDLDQHGNIGRVHALKLGRSVDYMHLTPNILHNEVLEILNNSLYYKTAQKYSDLYRNQPQKALDKAVFWIEFVLKHGSPEHLNLATRDFNFIQKHDIDIVLILIVVLGLLIFLTSELLQRLNKFFALFIRIKQKRQ